LHVLKPAADTTCLASSENGATLFAGAVDGSCGVWDVAKQTRVVQLNAHAGAVLSVAALGAHTLATGGEDGVVRLWDARSGKVARAFLPATGASRVEPEDAVARAAAAMSAPAAAAAAAPAAVTCVASGAGGEWLLAGGTARFLTLWHVGTAAPTSVFPTGGVPQQALLLGDRVAAVATDGVLYQWTVRGASLSARRSVHIRSLFTLARAPASSGAQEPPLVAGGASPFVDVYVYGNAYSFSIDIAPALHAQA
jgi:WD40 repeat protein